MDTPSLKLIDRAQLIKQGAEAKVYVLEHLFSAPQLYAPSLQSSAVSSSPTPSPPSHPTPTPTPTSTSASEPGPSTILKHRFPKTYRHPTLDATLTRQRLSSEARALARCLRQGVVVPRVLFVDERAGVLGLEKVEGWSVREVLGGGAEGEGEEEEGGGGESEVENEAQEEGELEGMGMKELSVDDTGADSVGKRENVGGSNGLGGLEVRDEAEEHEGMKALRELGVSQADLMSSIGAALAKLHLTTIIHGDLTTSNMMIRLTPDAAPGGGKFEIVMIDFGLSSPGLLPEHYAVDLYVLERAFASTHPASEDLYAGVLEAYAKGLGEKKWKAIESKLKEVRLRGRKRDMTG